MRLSRLFSHWEYVHSGTLTTLEKFQLEELSYTTFDGARPVAEIALHIANTEDGWIRFITRRQITEWPQIIISDDIITKEIIESELSRVYDETQFFLDSLELADLDLVIETPW